MLYVVCLSCKAGYTMSGAEYMALHTCTFWYHSLSKEKRDRVFESLSGIFGLEMYEMFLKESFDKRQKLWLKVKE